MLKGDLRSLFGLHPSYRTSMRRMAAFLLLLAGIQLLAWLLPTWADFKGVPYYLPLHELLETASIIVSMMVFAVGWNSRNSNLSGNVVLLASVFFSVAGLDFLHTISYVGMPDYISSNDSQKHLNFWLSARLFAALVLLLVAIRPSVAGSKLQVEIGHLPPVAGDSAMLRQVFVNLLSNAINSATLPKRLKSLWAQPSKLMRSSIM
jgi:hypothetical protein